MSLREWYTGREVLLTGVTSPLGQNLLEKILRSLPEDVKVHAIIKPKLALNTDERLTEEVLRTPGFERLKMLRPEAPLRVDTYAGDLTKDNLGLKPEEVELLRKTVSVVLHAGGPSERLLEFCKSLPKLKAVVVSNDVYGCKLFENCDRVPERVVDEKLPRGLPLAYVRMPALSPALRDPMPGYSSDLDGPTATIIGTGHVLGRSNFFAEIVPVDLAANTFLVTAWDVGNRKVAEEEPAMIYNAPSLGCTWGELIKKGSRASRTFPYPTFRIRGMGSSSILHWILIFLCEFVPSFLCDCVLFLMCQTPRVCREHMRVRKILRSFEPKIQQKLTVERRKAAELHRRLSMDEQESFPLHPDIDLEAYVLCAAASARKYCVDDTKLRIVFLFFPTIWALVLAYCGYYYLRNYYYK